MGRTNKTLQGAFTTIAGTSTERGAVEQFITRITEEQQISDQYSLANSSSDTDAAFAGQYSLANLISEYQIKSKNAEDTVNELALLETLIMQLSTRNSNLDDTKLYFNRKKYVYARCAFYRTTNEVKEIRVILGLVSNIYPKAEPTQKTLDELSNNKMVMNLAKMNLIEAMDKEIAKTIKSYDILKNNLEYSK